MGKSEVTQQIAGWVAGQRNRIVELTAQLVSHPTVNQVTDGTEGECQRVLQVLFEGMGLETRLYSPEEAPGFRSHPAYFPGKDYTRRPNVAGVWKGQGKGRSLLFSSHIDTAVVAPGWPASPWEPRVEQERVYGLGSFDMKGGSRPRLWP
ncbi:hypothetical protein N6H14_15705 [Paenibacillus sp. CC-CFT747]|nr:hypothetical protein N6H14_15705 [Paenibacillus sp. CC-CFT747]